MEALLWSLQITQTVWKGDWAQRYCARVAWRLLLFMFFGWTCRVQQTNLKTVWVLWPLKWLFFDLDVLRWKVEVDWNRWVYSSKTWWKGCDIQSWKSWGWVTLGSSSRKGICESLWMLWTHSRRTTLRSNKRSHRCTWSIFQPQKQKHNPLRNMG